VAGAERAGLVGFGGEGTTSGSIMLSFSFILFRLLRGTHTPSFVHSAPMRAEDFFTTVEGKKGEGDENGGVFSYVFPKATYLFWIWAAKRESFIHSWRGLASSCIRHNVINRVTDHERFSLKLRGHLVTIVQDSRWHLSKARAIDQGDGGLKGAERAPHSQKQHSATPSCLPQQLPPPPPPITVESMFTHKRG
jgi:hypothetical protein